jgi:DNA polymerase
MKLLSKDNVVTIDFETFYSQDYSLRAREYNTSSYIRDDQFHAHCVGVKEGQNSTEVYEFPEAIKKLSSLDLSDKYLLAHNAAFDGLILKHHYGIKPYKYLDTLAMSRALFGLHTPHDLNSLAERLGLGSKIHGALESTKGISDLDPATKIKLFEYNTKDVDLTYDAFWALYPSFPDSELELVSLTARMFCDPVLRLDMDRAHAYWLAQKANKAAKLLVTNGVLASDLLSNEKFASILKRRGLANLPMKTSLTTGKRTYAFAKTDPEFRKLKADPRYSDLFEAREALKSTIGETRAERFMDAGKDDMALPVMLNYYGAHTGRWSGGNKMNFQNLNRGGELRKSILAPPGYRLVVVDSAQIEARITAWLADHTQLLEAFASGKDVYKFQATKIYSVAMDAVTDEQRFVGKICILGLGFGMGPGKLQSTLEVGFSGAPPVFIDIDTCKFIVDSFRHTNKPITDLWGRADRIIEDMYHGTPGKYKCVEWGHEFIRLPNGLRLLYPNLRLHKGNWVYDTRYGHTKIYKGLLVENIVQALARCVIALHMLEVDKIARVVTMSHDEIVAAVLELLADETLQKMMDILRVAPSWAAGLPLNVTGGHDVFYSK